jgi:hypothetical protein
MAEDLYEKVRIVIDLNQFNRLLLSQGKAPLTPMIGK